MNLQDRKKALERLGTYMLGESDAWKAVQHRAFLENNWFIPEFVQLAVQNIAHKFLNCESLDTLSLRYSLPEEREAPKKVGIVMAGNIPLVGFHGFLCVFLSGHIALIKPSSKDEILIRHLVNKLAEWYPEVAQRAAVLPMIKGCDAYIATGSNNSSRYFEHYFAKYPHIIRRNRTSIAVLGGTETGEDLERLADDVHLYFGMGCRNVTKLLVPREYDFVPLLEAFNKYAYLINHHKFKNNYDYNLAIHILNNKYYMTNGTLLLVEAPAPFAPISQLHYEYYSDEHDLQAKLGPKEDVQCVVGRGSVAFGGAQTPGICDFADGVDTMAFLTGL